MWAFQGSKHGTRRARKDIGTDSHEKEVSQRDCSLQRLGGVHLDRGDHQLGDGQHKGHLRSVSQRIRDKVEHPSFFYNVYVNGLMAGRDVHVSTSASIIGAFMGGDRGSMMCFRCGETGHARYQCLQYKVRPCVSYERDQCTNKSCSYAHGPAELRTPWKAKCVRVVKHGGKFVCIGCYSDEHTFRRCPTYGFTDSKDQSPEGPLLAEVPRQPVRV